MKIEDGQTLRLGAAGAIGLSSPFVIEAVAKDVFGKDGSSAGQFADGVDPLRLIFDGNYYLDLITALYAGNDGSLAKVATSALVTIVSIAALESTAAFRDRIKPQK